MVRRRTHSAAWSDRPGGDARLCGDHAPARTAPPGSPDRARTASCSGPTSPTSVTTTAASPAATPPTTSGGPAAAAARSWSRAPASTRRTGRTSGRRWPRGPRPGWAAIVAACRPHGALVIASLDHAGGQGSSAYSQAPLWAPSRVPEVASREVPKWMEAEDIAAVVDGFATAAARRRRGRLRRRRDQRRPAQPGAPVPVRADEPAGRRVGRRPAALRPHRARRGARRRRRRPRRRPAPVLRRDRAVGRHHAGDGAADRRRPRRRRRRLRRRRAGLDLLDRADPARLPPADRASTSGWRPASPPPSTCPSCCRARSSTSARPSGPSAATTTRPRAPPWR